MVNLPVTGVGVGLRAPHYQAFIESRPKQAAWLEVHSENYFVPGSLERLALDALSQSYPLSLHGVGLSLGSAEPVSPSHLAKLRELIDCYQPALVSEHLSWSATGGRYFNDLLPLPLNRQVLEHFASQVDRTQQALGRQILIENPSSYLALAGSELTEWQFLAELQQRTQCGLLLDLNNIYVSGHNLGFKPEAYLDEIPLDAVGEIHLAGHREKDGKLIDTHGSPVCEPVWALYRRVLQTRRDIPVLIEWDTDIPPLETLLAQAAIAEALHGEFA